MGETGRTPAASSRFWLCEMLEVGPPCRSSQALHGKRGGRSKLTRSDKDGRGVQHRPSVYTGQQPCSYSTAALSCKGCFWHLSSSPTGLRNIKLTWWPSALRFCNATQKTVTLHQLFLRDLHAWLTPLLFAIKGDLKKKKRKKTNTTNQPTTNLPYLSAIP